MKRKNSTILLIVTTIFVVAIFGFKIQPVPFADYYYYQGKPYQIILVPDAIFVEFAENVDQNRFNELITNFPELYVKEGFSLKYKKDFVYIDESSGEGELTDLISRLNRFAEVINASPVFKVPEGLGNPNTLIGVEKEIIAQFKYSVTDAAINSYLTQRGMNIVQEFDLTGGNTYLIRIPAGQYAIDYANELYLSGLVNYSEPNLFFTNLLQQVVPNDPFFPQQWSHKNVGNNIPGGVTGTPGCDMRTDSAWLITMGSEDVIVSIVDTGIDTLHEDLHERIINGLSIDTYNNLPYAWDDQNHGTACAGIVAATGNNNLGVIGVAPESRLFGVKIFNSAGSTNNTAIINGLIAAWQRGSWVSSNSWGGGTPIAAADNAILDGVNLGRDGKGVVWSFATANSNASSLAWPSSNPNVLSVGGLSPCNQRKSTTSCDGETWWGANYGTGLEIVAPATKIYTTDRSGAPGYTTGNYMPTFNGTSSATPNASGVAALILALNPNLTWQQVREYICLTADKVGSYTYNQPGQLNLGGWNNEMGYGRINAYKALIYTLQFLGPTISHTPLPNTEQITGSYAVNCEISPNGGSTLILTETKLFWSRNNMSMTDSLVLTNTGGNNFTGNITSTGAGTYRYYIKSMDDENRVSTQPFGAPGSLFSFIAETDFTPPSITHTPVGNQPLIRWPVSISANVTDNIGVANVICEYNINSGQITGSFSMPLESGNSYKGTFDVNANLLEIGDNVQYRVKATDASSQSNEAFNPASGYHSFNIIDTKGIVLVVDDDVTLQDRYSSDKMSEPDLETPLGASSDLFSTTLTDAGYVVDNVTFSGLDVNTLTGYDIVVLSAGTRTTAMFSDQTKRNAIVNYTLAGGKTIVEGGEVGYIYRKSGTTTDLDPNFRRNVLNDSAWVSDVAGQNIFFKMPSHPIYKDPFILTAPITVTGTGFGPRDAVTIGINKPGVKKVGTWTTLQDSASIIVYYKDNDTAQPRNIFLTFAVGSIADQNTAKQLIENAAWILSPENIVPVELVSLNASVTNNNVTLNWITASELNNSGFSVERRVAGDLMYQSVGFVQGRGTTTEMSSYAFTDMNLRDGSYIYRLKQVDFDGSFEYSSEVYVDITAPSVYALEQNYPNPFNPSTLIKYSLSQEGMVNLVVYNLLGEKVAILVNEVQKAGRHEIIFDASQLASGIYFYRIEASSFSSVRKMLLMK